MSPTKTRTTPSPYFRKWNLSTAPAREEVEVPQAEDGEDVGGEDDERLAGEAEDGRHRVHREEDVGHLEEEEADEVAGGVAPPLVPNEEALAVETAGHGEALAELPDDPPLVRLDRTSLAAHHLHAREDEERAEEPHHPLELEERRPEGDEDPAEHESAEDPEEEHPVLVDGRHAEVGEDDDEHEDVVDRQRVLDHVPGQELEGRLAGGQEWIEAGDRHEPRVLGEVPPHVEVEGQVEEEGQGHPDARSSSGLADRDRVGRPVEDAEVQRQEDEDEEQEGEVEGPVLADREEAQGGIHGSRSKRRV